MSAAENESAIKNATPGINQGGVLVLPVGTQQLEKHGGNEEFSSGGAPGGATWGEIRVLISRCDDLPEDVRGRLVAMGDKSQAGAVELSTQ